MIGLSPSRRRGFAAFAAFSAVASFVVMPHAAHASATPVITAVPAVTSPGSTLVVTGSGLEDTSSVALGPAQLTDVTVVSPTEVTGVVPHGAVSGVVRLLTASGGSVDSATAVAVRPVVTGLSGRVGDHAALITWTGAGTGPTLVRDVTAVAPGPLTPTDGLPIPVTGLSARDTAFTNTVSRSYAVWATDADGSTSEAAATVTVVPAVVGSTITLARSLAVAPWGRTVILSGTLTRAGLPLPAHIVDLYGQLPGKPMTFLRRIKTAANGSWSTPVQPPRSITYSIRFKGDSFSGPSNVPTAGVRVLARLTQSFSPSTILRGEATLLRGQVLPRLAGVPLAVQQRRGTSWVTIAVARTATDGSYRLSMAPAVGVHTTRVVLPAQPGLASAASPTTVLRVDPRNLSSGMSGNDVLALQKLLLAQRYDPGALHGRYGYDTQHAVMAFQKLQRLPVTGRWGSAERLRATRPAAYKVRYPRAGRAVEISITRQILVLSEGGVVKRVIDISSGNNRYYTYDGGSGVAKTPRGKFSVLRKINGIRISHLGSLYKPSYFVGGFAIHGSASVPNYAASHGCIRITNPNADRIFPLLTIGTPVTVFDE